ncbi:MAG: hypothetical protein RIA63_01160 [Cyclobacteriaceae bacterium]
MTRLKLNPMPFTLKTPCALLATGLVCLGFASSAQIQVHEEPLHHPVFSTKDLRVLDVKANANDTSLMHQHTNNYCYVTMNGGKIWVQTQGENGRTVELKTGFTGGYFDNPNQPLVHRFGNRSESLLRLIAVENLSKIGNSRDTIYAKPENEEVIIENDFFRVTKVQLQANQQTEVQLKNPAVIINLDQRSLQFSKGLKNSPLVDWIYQEPNDKTTLINSSDDASVILVQIKR